jgi:hypothetical protein
MKKMIGIFAALMVALAMTGVAYACWKQTLYIKGTVETGEVCVGFVDIDCNDDGTDPGYTKDVGSCSCYLDEESWKCSTEEHGDAYETAVIEITNAYPSYSVTVTVTVANCGTIPVNAVDIGYEITGDLAPWVEITDYGTSLKPPYQIDPCNTATGWATIHIKQWVDFDEDGEEDPNEICPMNSSATIYAEILFCQWNETCGGLE